MAQSTAGLAAVAALAVVVNAVAVLGRDAAGVPGSSSSTGEPVSASSSATAPQTPATGSSATGTTTAPATAPEGTLRDGLRWAPLVVPVNKPNGLRELDYFAAAEGEATGPWIIHFESKNPGESDYTKWTSVRYVGDDPSGVYEMGGGADYVQGYLITSEKPISVAVTPFGAKAEKPITWATTKIPGIAAWATVFDAPWVDDGMLARKQVNGVYWTTALDGHWAKNVAPTEGSTSAAPPTVSIVSPVVGTFGDQGTWATTYNSHGNRFRVTGSPSTAIVHMEQADDASGSSWFRVFDAPLPTGTGSIAVDDPGTDPQVAYVISTFKPFGITVAGMPVASSPEDSFFTAQIPGTSSGRSWVHLKNIDPTKPYSTQVTGFVVFDANSAQHAAAFGS